MEPLKIALIGDVMCGDSYYAMGHGVASMLDKYGSDFLRPDLVDFLRGHDMVLFNMESVLSDIDRREHSLRELHMHGRAKAASYLANWGLTCANVANNHILEQGRACALDTVQQLHRAGIRTVGSGQNGAFEPGVQIEDLELKGHQLSVLSFCTLEEKYAYAGGVDFDDVLRAIQSRAQSGRTVIVSAHWGRELMDRPALEQRRMASQLIDAGASIVAGHHPHVVQGAQLLDGRLVAYSLGNFIFDSCLEESRWSMMLTVELDGDRVTQWRSLPVALDGEHRPVLAEGRRKGELESEIARRCDSLTAQESSTQYEQAYVAEFMETDRRARRRLWWWLLKTLPRKKLVFWPQLFFRPIQRRLGWW